MRILLLSLSLALVTGPTMFASNASRVYVDRPFLQDYSEKVPLAASLGKAELLKVRADRNGRILVLSDKGLLQVHEGRLKPDRLHRPLADMQIKDIDVHQGQFVYLTDESVLSNAWAGRLLLHHDVPDAKLLAMENRSDVMVSGDSRKQLVFDDGMHEHRRERQFGVGELRIAPGVSPDEPVPIVFAPPHHQPVHQYLDQSRQR